MRKYNCIGEFDEKGNSFYLILPPFTSKSRPPEIHRTETIQFKNIFITADFYENRLVGIEISDALENIDLNLPPPRNPNSRPDYPPYPPEITIKSNNETNK